MSERDAVALAWAILVSLAIAGAVPASWAIVVFPAVYVALVAINAFLAGFAEALMLGRSRR